MNARRKLEMVLADIFGQYITDFKVLPGRGNVDVKTPYFCVLVEECVEDPVNSGIYLGDAKFIVITDSNQELSEAQDQRIGEVMQFVRELSQTMTNGNCQIVDPDLCLVVDGMCQLSQSDAIDDQSFGDMVALRVGFRETNTVQAVSPGNSPIIQPKWWVPSGPKVPKT